MKYRAMFFAGAAIGYVLGTKAGRERYEQIRLASQRVTENPTVQEAAGVLRAKGEEFAGAAKERVPDQIGNRMPGRSRSETPDEYTEQTQESAATAPHHGTTL